MSGERIDLGAPITVTVSATDVASGAVVFDRSVTLRPVVYESPDGARIVYANGAVVGVGENGGAALLREPPMVLSATRSLVAVTNTSRDTRALPGGPEGVQGESRVLVQTVARERQVLNRSTSPVNVTVTVSSPRATAWESYLEAAIDPTTDDCTRPSPTTVTCTVTTDRATVVETRIGVSFE